MTAASGIYVYGLALKHAQLVSVLGINDEPTRPLPAEDLVAIVSDVRSLVEPRRRHLLAHARVLDELSRTACLLPFRFGTVLPGEDAIRSELHPRTEQLAHRLRELDGLTQLTCIARHDEDTVIRQVIAGQPQLARAAADASMTRRMEAGRKIAARVAELRDADSRLLKQRIPSETVAARFDATSPERVARLALLVRRDRVDEVSQQMRNVAEETDGRLRLDLLAAGPAYDFAEGV